MLQTGYCIICSVVNLVTHSMVEVDKGDNDNEVPKEGRKEGKARALCNCASTL